MKVKKKEIGHKNNIHSIVTLREQRLIYYPRGVNQNNLVQTQLDSPPSRSASNKEPLVVALVNNQSVNKNGIKIKGHVVEHVCDIIAVVETWLPCDEILANQIVGDTCLKGFKMSHIPRNNGQQGGGVCIMYKNCLDIRSFPETGMP